MSKEEKHMKTMAQGERQAKGIWGTGQVKRKKWKWTQRKML